MKLHIDIDVQMYTHKFFYKKKKQNGGATAAQTWLLQFALWNAQPLVVNQSKVFHAQPLEINQSKVFH